MFIKCFLLLSAITLLAAHHLPLDEVELGNGRIIGGHDESIEKVPWQVSLQLSGRHYCGGSIYNEKIIVTAAHCYQSPQSIKVRVGSTKVNEGGSLVSVAKFVKHEKYGQQRFALDIAVILLSEPLSFGVSIQPIPLAKKSPPHNADAIVTGWGTTRLVPCPLTLQRVDIQIISNAKCKGLYGDLITEDMICAGKPGATVCHNDSGGPLVVNGSLVGVVSYGAVGCVTSGVFADVAVLHDWIENAAKNITNVE